MIEQIIRKSVIKACSELYHVQLSTEQIQLQKTKKEFTGDTTLVVFPLLRFSKQSPEQTAEALGDYLQHNVEQVRGYNVIQGFLNIVIKDSYWLSFLYTHSREEKYGFSEEKKQTPVVIEFSAPNTNKPLHLGHIRNNLLGSSLSAILKAAGKSVQRINLVNDRGIHICKSMLAWQKWGGGETPESSGKKGDKLVGEYYVRFETENKKYIQQSLDEGKSEKQAAQNSPLILEAQTMLQKWEANDPDIRALWEKMNNWVYEGFEDTYKRLGIAFEKTYYESQTYLLGKEMVKKGLEDGLVFQKEDTSIWADLSAEGLDEKLLLRADGTSVYITQDLGSAKLRQDDFKAGRLVYVVGNEQIYHFEVLKILLKKLGYVWAENIYHLPYGMVQLPHGKMKSREGTVVDADELMEEMFQTAKRMTTELGKLDDFSEQEAQELFEMIGLGALKYFILKVDPMKNMLFNPEESIDFTGNTAPFIQYTHARIKSLIRKATEKKIDYTASVGIPVKLHIKEKNILRLAHEYQAIIQQAADNYTPAIITNYIYELTKEFNQFYQEIPILKEPDIEKVKFRLLLSKFTADIIRSGMSLLGITVPDRM